MLVARDGMKGVHASETGGKRGVFHRAFIGD